MPVYYHKDADWERRLENDEIAMDTVTPAERLAEIKREQDEGEPLVVVLNGPGDRQLPHGDIYTLTDTHVAVLDGDNEPHTVALADIVDVERADVG